MFDSPSEYDHGYNMAEDYPIYRYSRHCEKCGQGLGVKSGKLCSQCDKYTMAKFWQEMKDMFREYFG